MQPIVIWTACARYFFLNPFVIIIFTESVATFSTDFFKQCAKTLSLNPLQNTFIDF